MSAKGTTWKKGCVISQNEITPKANVPLPTWAYDLIHSLSAEIQLLRDENERLKIKSAKK